MSCLGGSIRERGRPDYCVVEAAITSAVEASRVQPLRALGTFGRRELVFERMVFVRLLGLLLLPRSQLSTYYPQAVLQGGTVKRAVRITKDSNLEIGRKCDAAIQG